MADPQFSRVHRFAVGDQVLFTDPAEWPPVDMQGEIVGFANDELTYLTVAFAGGDERVLTEDDVRRVQ